VQGQNAVHFDLDMAIGYDRTRPFCSPEEFPRLFHPLFDKLLAARPERDKLRVLDAGCGTGRISLPLLLTYETWRSLDAHAAPLPPIELVAVDSSADMIRHFQKNMTMAGISASDPRIQIINHDIRDAAIEQHEKFDLIIAHWLFHTMLDWRTAALRLDAVAAEDGHILSLQETSPYYDALDGDFMEVTGRGRQFWEQFHEQRRGAIRSFHDHGKFLPPSMRLGPRVNDERVAQMFLAFGWEESVLELDRIDFHHAFTSRELVELVTFGRAFTSLRIGAKQEVLQDLYSTVAQHLLDDFTHDGVIESKADFPFSIMPRLFKRKRERKIRASLIIDMARDTISARRSHSMFDLFNKGLLWERLFNTVLPRLSRPSPVFDLFGDQLEFTVAVPPYNQNIYCDRVFENESDDPRNLWRWLVGNVETDDVIHIARIGDSTAVVPIEPDEGPRMVPYESNYPIDARAWRFLVRLGKIWRSTEDDGLLEALPAPIRSDLLRRAKRGGLIGFSDNEAVFLGALARTVAIASEHDCNHIYLLPVRERFGDQDPGSVPSTETLPGDMTFGMMVGSKKPLCYSTISLLWLIVDLLMIDYHEHKSGASQDRPVTKWIDPNDRNAVGLLPAWRTRPAADAFESQPDVHSPCDVLILSINRRENRAIESCFAGKLIRTRNATLPKAWEAPAGFRIVHAKIDKGNCADQVEAHLKDYAPRAVILAGTMGGAWPDRHAFADVVVATEILARDEVDKEPGGILRPQVGATMQIPAAREKWLRDMVEQWNRRPFKERRGLNKAYAGRIMCGRGYEGDREKLWDYAKKFDFLGYEMEAVDFCRTVLKHGSKPAWAIIKGISDFADKHNYYQPVAALRAAEFITYLCEKSDLATAQGIFSPEFLDDGEEAE